MPDASKAALSNIEETSAVSDEMRQQSSMLASEKSAEKASEVGSKKETEAASSERAASSSAASSKAFETYNSSGDNTVSTALSDVADSPSASSGAVYVLHPVQTFSSPEEFATSSVTIDAYQYTVINRLDIIAVSLLISAGLLFFLVLRNINSSKR